MSPILDLLPRGLRERFDDWRRRRKLAHEFETMGIDETTRILRDVGLSLDDMGSITKPHAGPEVMLPQRLELLGIDPSYLATETPNAYRELQRTCLLCRSWRQCARDLAAHDTQSGMDHYCLNSAAIDEMLVSADRAAHAPRT